MTAGTSTSVGTVAQQRQRESSLLALLSQPWVVVSALTLVAFLLRRYHLGFESLWFDEADIVRRAQQPVGTLLQGFTAAGENGPLYTLLLHYWLSAIDAFPILARPLHLVFGPNTEAPIRGLSVLFGTAAIPLIYLLGRKVGGQWLGIISAVLLTVNPFHIWHSQDVKMYTLLVLMTIASTLLYVEALERNTLPLWAGYLLATWVMLTVHSMAGLVLLAQLAATPFLVRNLRAQAQTATAVAATYRPEGSGRTRWVRWGWAMLLILGPLFPIAWLRLAALVTGTVDVGGWYPATGLADILLVIFVKFAVNQAIPPWEAVGGFLMAGLVLVYLGLRLSVIRWRPRFTLSAGASYTALLVCLWAVPIVVFWLVTLTVPLFQPRYLIMSLPAYLIMAAAGLLVLRRAHPVLPFVVGGVLGLATVAALLSVNYSQQPQKEDWRGAMSYVQDHLRLRDVIVVFPGYLVTAVDEYYKPGGPGHVPQQDIKTIPSLRTEGFGPRELDMALQDAVKCHERAWLVTSPPRQQQEDPDNKVLQWFQYNYHTFDTQVFNGVTVYGIAFNGQAGGCWYPEPTDKEPHTFANGLQFLGYIYELRDNATVQPDASYLPLTFYWHNPAKLDTDYLIRVQVKDKTGKPYVDEALAPLNGYWPTSQWPPGAYVIDYRDPRLPGGMPEGNYTVTLQVYPEDHPEQPLKLQDGNTEIVFKQPLRIVPWKP